MDLIRLPHPATEVLASTLKATEGHYLGWFKLQARVQTTIMKKVLGRAIHIFNTALLNLLFKCLAMLLEKIPTESHLWYE